MVFGVYFAGFCFTWFVFAWLTDYLVMELNAGYALVVTLCD